ncbi:MAG: DUF2892 domain-containing protein [Proteobacteria bacterium]|nr:DUF2892 domain-containing protein [Pseudomonadota bacterium]
MHVERITRGAAGTMIVASLALSQLHSPWWLLLTALVGLNLLQSAFTDTCPLLAILRRVKAPSKG